MNLLICTQAIDRDDPNLGFFHTWVEKLAPNYERIIVFALRVGERELPQNVEVVHLGDTRVMRIWRILNESRKRRGEYDAVFVHMSQEFVLLAGWLWRSLGKRVFLWRNHYAGSGTTDIAAGQCRKIFYTSKFSYTAKYRHAVQMPVGVDTDHFTRLPSIFRDPRGVLFLARLTPSKRPHVLLQALGILARKKITFAATLCGAQTTEDKSYIAKLHKMVIDLGLMHSVVIKNGVPPAHTPELFNHHALFVNCSPSGMYDKTLFEAASCECGVVASSKDFAELVSSRFIFEDGNAEDLANKLETLLTLPVLEQQGIGAQMRNSTREHSLSHLIHRLVEEMA